MIIQDVIVSKELMQSLYFCCNLQKCRGICCVAGDAGAPLEFDEIEQIQANLEQIKPFMQEKAANIITENTVFDYDQEASLVTALFDNRECVFTNFENNIAYCSIERAYNLGLINFRKPISCFLYPIRVTKDGSFKKIEFHKWNICQSAHVYGKSTGVELVDFLKTPLIEYFGEEWYKLYREAVLRNKK